MRGLRAKTHSKRLCVEKHLCTCGRGIRYIMRMNFKTSGMTCILGTVHHQWVKDISLPWDQHGMALPCCTELDLMMLQPCSLTEYSHVSYIGCCEHSERNGYNRWVITWPYLFNRHLTAPADMHVSTSSQSEIHMYRKSWWETFNLDAGWDGDQIYNVITIKSPAPKKHSGPYKCWQTRTEPKIKWCSLTGWI